jgi:subtilase family serine protease
VDAVVADGRAKIATLSYGFCYAPGWVSSSLVDALNTSLKAAVAAGVTLFVASGDSGAYTCHMFDKASQDIAPAFPGCGDNLVSVGGTYVELHADGTYRSEAGWEDYLVAQGTGGGISPLDPRPAWQTGVPGVDNQASNGKRQCPDVSGPGDPDTGYLVYQTEDGQGEWKMIGGTSGSSPFWAGMAALLQQAAAKQGVSQLGFLGPLLYKAAAAHPEAFHDVTRGGNLLDNATAGWDYATGIGTPVGTKLVDAVIAAAKGQ